MSEGQGAVLHRSNTSWWAKNKVSCGTVLQVSLEVFMENVSYDKFYSKFLLLQTTESNQIAGHFHQQVSWALEVCSAAPNLSCCFCDLFGEWVLGDTRGGGKNTWKYVGWFFLNNFFKLSFCMTFYQMHQCIVTSVCLFSWSGPRQGISSGSWRLSSRDSYFGQWTGKVFTVRTFNRFCNMLKSKIYS